MGLDKRGAERLFQVPTEREEKTAAAIASNDSFSAWTKTFTDPRLCAAIVDRLTFGGNIIETGTRVVDRSVRCQHAIDPTLRPQCTLTATLQVGTIALCSSCHSRRSSVGKGQPATRRAGLDRHRPANLLRGRTDPVSGGHQSSCGRSLHSWLAADALSNAGHKTCSGRVRCGRPLRLWTRN